MTLRDCPNEACPMFGHLSLRESCASRSEKPEGVDLEGLEARREVCGVRACLEETKGPLKLTVAPT